jgi:hypothetical protein
MNRVAGHAQTEDALIALRLRDATLVFDPVAVLGHGDTQDAVEDDRQKRGEKWVEFPTSYGVPFGEWYDGAAEPIAYNDVEDYA